MAKIFLIFFLVAFLLWWSTTHHYAAVSSCGVSLFPHQYSANSYTTIEFQVYNSSSSVINWVKFTRPTSDYTIIDGETTTGWTVTFTDDTAIFTGATLPINASYYFGVRVSTSGTSSSAASWGVETADDGSGASKTTCTGNTLSSTTTSDDLDYSDPIIINVAVTNLTSSGAKITWTTNENASSIVHYGTSAAYGATKTDGSYVTSHSIDLTSLSANTTYHFLLESIDSAGNNGYYADSTLSTAVAQATPSPIVTTVTIYTTPSPVSVTVQGTPSPIPTPSPIVVFFEDKDPPQVNVTTDLSQPFTQPPLMKGTVEDNKKGNIVEILYSIDGGRNWLPVDQFDSPGAESSAFSFLPEIRDDGNYQVIVQARDGQGNVGASSETTLIIDRLEPRIGGGFISLGALPLPFEQSGVITTLVGLDHKITLGAVGGATTIDVTSGEQLFSLVKNPDTGLWSGVVSLQKAGIYELTGRAVDGVGRRTERVIATIEALAKGVVKYHLTPLPQAEMTVYVFDAQSQTFVSWDARAYGQENPQQVEIDGEYTLELPAGRYYLGIRARNYKYLKTNIFDLDETTPIQLNFDLTKKKTFTIGPWYINWLDIWPQTISIDPNPEVERSSLPVRSVVGQELSYLNLLGENEIVNLTSFRGEPTVLTFVTTWSPQTSQQLQFLQKLTTKTFQVGVVFVQENVQTITNYKKRATYTGHVYADPDGEVVSALQLFTYPTHVFVNRKGTIEKVSVGVLTSEEIVDQMVN